MSTFSVEIEVAALAALGVAEHSRYWHPLSAVVDTGASFSVVPADVLHAVGIHPHTSYRFALADGRDVESEVGRALFRIEGREEISLVVFGLPGEPTLVGAHTLESLLLGVDPHHKRLIPVNGLRY